MSDEENDAPVSGRAFMDEEAGVSSDEENGGKGSADEDEEEDEAGNIADLIDDGEERSKGKHKKKRKHRKRDEGEEEAVTDDNDEDDLDVIREHYGEEVTAILKDRKSKKKHKRLKRIGSDDSESEEEVVPKVHADAKDARDKIAESLFRGASSSQEQAASQPQRKAQQPSAAQRDLDAESFDSEEDEMDDFIDDADAGDDEDGEGPALPQPAPKPKRRAKKGITPEMRAALDVFGSEWLQYVQGESEAESEEFDDEALEDMPAEEREAYAARKSRKKKGKLIDLFSPDELDQHHLLPTDVGIVKNDQPERLQTLFGVRQAPAPGACAAEANWIVQNVLRGQRISEITDEILRKVYRSDRSTDTLTAAVESVVTLLRWDEHKYYERNVLKFDCSGPRDIPFIAQYRKERVSFPDVLNCHDLWAIYRADKIYTDFLTRREKIHTLFTKVKEHQESLDPEETRSSYILTDSDVASVMAASTDSDLNDLHHFLTLHCAESLSHLQSRAAPRKNFYFMCKRSGILGCVDLFGLSVKNLAENFIKGFMSNEPHNCDRMPEAVAAEFLFGPFNTTDKVLSASRQCLAMQIAAEPSIKRFFREAYLRNATISVRTTSAGNAAIEDWTPMARFRFVTCKPLNTLKDDEFAWILRGETLGYFKVTIEFPKAEAIPDYHPNPHQRSFISWFNETFDNYYKLDREDELSSEWNRQRYEALRLAVEEDLFPLFEKEVREKLLGEASQFIIEQCANCVRVAVNHAPFKPLRNPDEDEEEHDRDSLRVLAIALGSSGDKVSVPTFAAFLSPFGDCVDSQKYDWLSLRTARTDNDTRRFTTDRENLKSFIRAKNPDVIAIAAENLDCQRLERLLHEIVQELRDQDSMHEIPIEFVDPCVAHIYQNSWRAEREFKEYVPRLRFAISIGRRLQSPELEYAGLLARANDQEILCLKMHPLQEMAPRGELLDALTQEIISVVNRVGIDLNRAVNQSHVSYAMQFISGLGPHTADALLASIRNEGRGQIFSREQLVTFGGIGPVVAHNCAGFLRIAYKDDPYQEDDGLVDILDSTRVHPFEGYEFARKIAMDTMDQFYGEAENEMNLPTREASSQAIKELLENIEENRNRLMELDLAQFAAALMANFGDKRATLEDIRSEFKEPFQDTRHEYDRPNRSEMFTLLTGETISPEESPQLYHLGERELFFHKHRYSAPSLVVKQLITCRVHRFRYRRPDDDSEWNRVTHEPVGDQFSCSMCKQLFPSSDGVIDHLTSDSCPGKPTGFSTMCDEQGGIQGFVSIANISDSRIASASERVQPGAVIQCRVKEINTERFSLYLTCKSSDLRGDGPDYTPAKWGWDEYYDVEAAARARNARNAVRQRKGKEYIKRRIDHPKFMNVTLSGALEKLKNMAPGEAIFRPSSKGTNHIAITWQVLKDVFQHIDVVEEGKADENAVDLGPKLVIDKMEFEDIDEILARYIDPMADLVRQLVSKNKVYRAVSKDDIDEVLREEKAKNPAKIPYYVIPDERRPGYFLLCYMPGKNSILVERVTVTPDGFRMRHRNHSSVDGMINWFKRNYNAPSAPPADSHHQHSSSSSSSAAAAAAAKARAPAPQQHAPQSAPSSSQYGHAHGGHTYPQPSAYDQPRPAYDPGYARGPAHEYPPPAHYPAPAPQAVYAYGAPQQPWDHPGRAYPPPVADPGRGHYDYQHPQGHAQYGARGYGGAPPPGAGAGAGGYNPAYDRREAPRDYNQMPPAEDFRRQRIEAAEREGFSQRDSRYPGPDRGRYDGRR
eukprot:m.211010 g.211010  ORF g.211010 m.211010 type:complete len:1767 (+) comp17822_c0_seq2:479-5779(+)